MKSYVVYTTVLFFVINIVLIAFGWHFSRTAGIALLVMFMASWPVFFGSARTIWKM